ncbi:hypothetical protein ACPB8Q_00860 [Methanocaldococcus indicus]|uniref:hypothetical protein n=1 Tax=Methanocaldococcus indicus TaxID=213231 RepID=UPI003C6D6385
MKFEDYLNYIFLFQDVIKEGNLKFEIKNLFCIVVDNKTILINILDIKNLKKIVNLLSILQEERNKKKDIDIVEKLKEFRELLKYLNNIGKKFKDNKKKLIFLYKNRELFILGEGGGIFIKYAKINKFALLSFIKEFLEK